MKNFIKNGVTMPYVVPISTTLTEGQVVILGTGVLAVVLSTNNNTGSAVTGETVTLSTYGVFNLSKVTGSGTGWGIGDLVYWDSTVKKVTGIGSQSGVAPTTTIAITTASALNDTLASLTVNGVALLAGPLTLVADGVTLTETQISNAINAHTTVSGFSATHTADTVTVTAPVGTAFNTFVIVTGAVTGTMVLNTANGNSAAFSGGLDATTAIPIGWGWDQDAADGDTLAAVKLKT